MFFFDNMCVRQRACARVRLSAHVMILLGHVSGRGVFVCVFCVCMRQSKRVYDKYSVFISMSGGVS